MDKRGKKKIFLVSQALVIDYDRLRGLKFEYEIALFC